jgi:YidC/Oxa1 family membrane protein insertase
VQVEESGWIGFTDKYWMTTLIPGDGQPFTSVTRYVASADIYQTEARLPVMSVAPGATGEVTTLLFAGAKEWETIRDYQNAGGIDRFIDSIDWGWFFFLTKPMFWLLHNLNVLIGNMGWAIIALTSSSRPCFSRWPTNPTPPWPRCASCSRRWRRSRSAPATTARRCSS